MHFARVWINEDTPLGIASAFFGAGNKGVVAAISKADSPINPVYELSVAVSS